jgi:hypothetical protein
MKIQGQMSPAFAVSFALALQSFSLAFSAVHNRAHQPDQSAEDEANQIANEVNADIDGPKSQISMAAHTTQTDLKKQQPDTMESINVQSDAHNAKQAAGVARQAAEVANKVAEHSIHITSHAKSALHHALGALHDARVDTQGLSSGQKESLKKAEGQLREATKKADYGKLKKLEDKNALDRKKDKMQDEMDKKALLKREAELEQLRAEVKHLREELKNKGGDDQEDKELRDMQDMLNKRKDTDNNPTNDELKAEIEALREQIDRMEKREAYDVPKVQSAEEQDEEEKEELMQDVKMQPLESPKKPKHDFREAMPSTETTPVEEKGIDIDTAMPYGDLEPFGREDTAQELTENSVKESDEMVDQLERAEVAEEKRAVFRALTRLRGAAITSFDGVARSQTGNIDEYNKIHKWRKTHPLHHLADEESDVTKWAFPDNAD